MAHQTVLGELAQQGPHVLFDAGTRDVAELLTLVGIHLAGADVEAPLGEAHGAIGEQGQQGGVGIAGVGRMGGERMGRCGKGGHGQILGALYLAGLGVQAHGPASGQEEELALLGQGHEFVRTGRAPFLAAAADHEQVGIIIDVALGIGHDHMRFDFCCCHFPSLRHLALPRPNVYKRSCGQPRKHGHDGRQNIREAAPCFP